VAPIPNSRANHRLSQWRCESLGKFHLNFYHRPIDKRGLRASPLNSFGVECRHIPEYARVAATAWLRSRQLLIQLPGNKVVLIPELLDPGICYPGKNRSCGPAPIRRQDRFPDHQNRQVDRLLLLQLFFDCGGPPQATRSCG